MSRDSLPDDSLIEHFIETFEGATGAEISGERSVEVPFQRPDGMHRLDLLLRMQRASGETLLAVELLRAGYPRDVRNAVWQLEEFRLSGEEARSVAPIVIAEHLSPGAREILRERQIGYFDASGSLFLKHGEWLINIERTAKPAAPRRAGALFTGAKEQVVHALLHSGQQWLTGLEVAGLAETSPYTVSLTLKELERQEWVESEGGGRTLRRRLAQPGRLLDAWAEAWRKRDEHRTRWYAYAPNPNALLLMLAEKLEQAQLPGWAFTGAVAANVLAPLLTSVEIAEAIVPPGRASGYAAAMGLTQVDQGSNVVLVEREGASLLFRRELPGASPSWCASPFIQYLDLQNGRGRSKELASHLRAEILKV